MKVSTKRRRLALLLGLLGVLAVMLVAARGREPAAPALSASNPAGASRPAAAPSARTAGRAAQHPEAPAADVKLDALAAPRPAPIDGGRSLFRFQQKAPPPAPPPPQGAPRSAAGVPGVVAAPPAPAGPPTPPPPPPIPLKFIGIVEATKGGLKLAVLSDGRAVYHGREGEIVEGRYRVVRIGVESVEMEYVDGRGRQTIRLSGS